MVESSLFLARVCDSPAQKYTEMAVCHARDLWRTEKLSTKGGGGGGGGSKGSFPKELYIITN